MKNIDEIRRNRLEDLVNETKSKSLEEVAEIAGTSSAYLSQIRNQLPDSKTGRPKKMGDQVAEKLRSAFNKPSGWMDADISTKEEITLANNDEYPAIKRVNLKLSAGIVGFGIDYDVEDRTPIVMQREWFKSRGFKPENLIATKVKGDSMQPGLYDGDTVVINTAEHTPVDGHVYAINYEGEMLIKRMVRDTGVWWLSSDNQDQRKHPRKECNSDLCIIIGKVVHKQSEVI